MLCVAVRVSLATLHRLETFRSPQNRNLVSETFVRAPGNSTMPLPRLRGLRAQCITLWNVGMLAGLPAQPCAVLFYQTKPSSNSINI